MNDSMTTAAMEQQVRLSNVQIELLKLYSTNLGSRDLSELKTILAKFYAERATRTADLLWDNKRLSNVDMNAWLNEQ